MKTIVYENEDIQDEVMNELYKIYEKNMKNIAKGIVQFNDEHKKKWCDSISNVDNNRLIIYYDDNDTFLGYMIFDASDEMTYITEFQLLEDKQGDGETFENVLRNTFKYATPNKPIKFKVWPTNTKMAGIVKKFHAKFDKESRLTIEYDTMKKYINGEEI